MNVTVQFQLNGRPRRLGADSARPVLEVLREDLGLTGAKYGCGEGQCRACTVLLDGKPTPSCLLTVGELEGKTLETIEGLAPEGHLHPVQEAFVQEGAMQCGYCVPGMILAAVGLLRRNPHPTRGQIVDALNGNLCRCCGYPNVIKAVERAATAAPAKP
jgi:aerobic-type carbon monoxide dehydrogenase small subunit (CoxS/CutS family)